MITVAIVAIIAGIAIPDLLAARKAGREAAAISLMRQIFTAQNLHHQRTGRYAESDEELVLAGYLNVAPNSFAGPNQVVNGYRYIIQNPTSTFWFVRANPDEPGITGDRYFVTGPSGVIRFSTTGPAGANDPPIE